jgi:hypothetical protein
VRRIPRSPVSYADADQARRRRLPAKWLAAMLITAAVALLAPGDLRDGYGPDRDGDKTADGQYRNGA